MVLEVPGGQVESDKTRVVLGFRPEDLEDAAIRPARPGASLRVTVDIRENMGAEVYVHFSLAVPPVRRHDVQEAIELLPGEVSPSRPATFVARVGRETGAREGEPLELSLDTSRLYFFDLASGDALRRA